MKNRLLLISVLFLLCFAPAAQAGFLVKRHAITVVHTVAGTHVSGKEKRYGFLAGLHKYHIMGHPYTFRKKNEWVGIAALGCGIIGLFVPGVNLLALLFGVLGMGRGCDVQGLAIAGFVMGMLELLLFLLIQTVFVSLILL